jgi:hypothetical protein
MNYYYTGGKIIMTVESYCIQSPISITEFVELLCYYRNIKETTNYMIEEEFAKKGKVKYNLLNLSAEIEDEYIMFDDGEGILEDGGSVFNLRIQLLSEILSITYFINESFNFNNIRMRFKDGSIFITVVNK